MIFLPKICNLLTMSAVAVARVARTSYCAAAVSSDVVCVCVEAVGTHFEHALILGLPLLKFH